MRALFHFVCLTVLNLHPVGFRCLEFTFSKLLYSEPSSALNRLLNTEWFQAGTLSSKITSFVLYSDWLNVGCQRTAVHLWPQLWSPTPPIWDTCGWVSTGYMIQEWSCCVIFYRIQTVDWRLWGQTPFFISVLEFSLTLTTSATFHVYFMHEISIIVNRTLGNIYLKYRVSNVEILDQASVPLVRLLHERQQHVFGTIFRRIFSMNLDPKLWIVPWYGTSIRHEYWWHQTVPNQIFRFVRRVFRVASCSRQRSLQWFYSLIVCLPSPTVLQRLR